MGRDRPPRRCNACEQPVLWWRNANREGKSLCVDLSSDPDLGTVQKIVSGTAFEPEVFGKVLSGTALADAVASAEQLFTLHAITCSAKRPLNPKPAGLEIVRPATRSRR